LLHAVNETNSVTPSTTILGLDNLQQYMIVVLAQPHKSTNLTFNIIHTI